MTQAEKAAAFAALHVKGTPLVLYNIWDAGSAQALAKAGARAIATGSWSVAAAQGFADGQALPMADALRTARQIVTAVDLPVTIDFEGGYAEAPVAVANNVSALLDTGAVGLNFEDQRVGGEGLHDMAEQAARITAIRAMADARGIALFINARTDLFLKADRADHAGLIEQAIARGHAYADAGASGFFVPGLQDIELIEQVCAGVSLPVNVMHLPDLPDTSTLGSAGVARISHGPFPYRAAMAALGLAAKDAMGG
ncbi:2-methylisocitrate lyase-like PEP mutase family enzyme [Rubricella aquisinus]|uniref:2-methylisocitrate lyase-like PEP mutase family enzyme n=1 Tax=Rubricella aquisinus TaxID=2028108 RepID=A0A840WSR7_9RHOB|nr:isocitrate lyase/phosphoenolpyruvate mutase family protein [Rubricella aquisinus]MBB5516712.1 2-methylisocitrate lyase-like PEP mutase family enzyme [Rubricella aquisinus]